MHYIEFSLLGDDKVTRIPLDVPPSAVDVQADVILDSTVIAPGMRWTLVGLPPKPKECDECTDAGRCSRIGQCLRFKCAFGEVNQP